jgi:hypothetical protein
MRLVLSVRNVAMREKLYTVAEANAILPEVRRLVERMLRARAEIVQLQPTLWPAVQAAEPCARG